jgi:hypothetical protein
MTHKNTALAAAVCFTLLAGCASKTGGPAGVEIVDFHDYVEKPLSELGDKFYTDKRYVALRADEQNMMIGPIMKVVIYGEKLFVAEDMFSAAGRNPNQKLVVHDAEGQAIAKVGNKGRGPGEYMQITDFDVDRQGRVHLYDGNVGAKKIFIFDTDYRFVEEKQLPFSIDIMKCTPDGGYLFVLSTWDKSELTGKRFVKTDADLNVVATAGEYNMEQIDNNFVLGDGSLVATPDGYYCQRAPDETLYLLNEEADIEKRWFFDFGRYSIPIESRDNLEPIMMTDGRKSYRFIRNLVTPWGKYILGTMNDGDVFNKSFAYDTGAGINYTTTNESDFHNFGSILTITDGRLVTIFPYFDGETFPADLPAELHAGVADGDPLLCLYELK